MLLVRVRGCLLRNPGFQFRSYSVLQSQRLPCLSIRQNILCSEQTWRTQTRTNTQHRVILLPELPPDTGETNPLLKTIKNELPALGSVSEANCYYGLGKALMTYESTVCRMEEQVKAGEKDWEKLLRGLEESRVELESVWNSVNLINIVTDSLDMDRFTSLNKRAERAFLSRYDSRDIYNLITSEDVKNVEGEEKILLQRYQLEYKNQGYELPEKKYLELNSNWMKRLSEAQRDHRFKITTSTQRFRHIIRDPTIVREFPVDLLRAMAADSSQPARGPWSVTLHPYVHRKFMEYCPERRLRYRTYADMSMATKMAGKVENVTSMIASMAPRAKTAQEIELAALQEYAETRGFEDSIKEFDVEFFKRKQIRTLFNIEEEAMREFFPLPHVLETIFILLKEHYNLVFTLVKPQGAEKPWSEEVSIYRVTDNQGNFKGHCYLDPYIRDDKGYQGGDRGWYVPLRTSSGVAGSTPVGCIVMALGAPGYGKPSLLSFNEVEELLRQIGKSLVHLSATKKWAETSGRTGVEWDALNLVPELMTHWLSVPSFLTSVSKHWSTGEELSPVQVENQIQAKKHMSGYATSHELFKAAFDISFYSEDFENEQYQALVDRLTPQYLVLAREREDCFPLYFEDILTGNLAAGYYSHLWSRMLAADVFSAYWESGWEDKEAISKVSRRITRTLLSAGSSAPMVEIFRELRGRDPNPEALMISLGLSGSRKSANKS
ncbi:probable cytosolic oligopeptidase A [Eurytemora carolleeae]|uniref:probable cytosolic oligopeptidase A n=1 Tax=Eurytemora carolleeae TaxID=1294199 RepID=UPI000C78B238|nr:probable cytosolic oligopeptidase A [Eurytemora carolleeae]|eukprot:XP_023323332.1 probable cytosolic oligopeptidase A [Eurytemora affinis]